MKAFTLFDLIIHKVFVKIKLTLRKNASIICM